jgi:sulfide:quinone oxidoreductase
MEMVEILILGGGSAGIMSAARLRRALPMDEAEITIVEKSDKHIYQPGFTLIVFGLEEPENIVRPMKDIIPAGVNFIQDEVTKINPDENTVETKGGKRLEYDYLVIATGARLLFEEIEGVEENLGKDGVHTFYTLDGAIALKKALEEFDGGKIVLTQGPLPFKCPGAPLKFVLMSDDYFRRKGMRDKVEITLTTTLPRAFAREPYATKFDQIFEDRHINVVTGFTPASVDVEKKEVKSFEEKTLNFDLLVVVPANGGQEFLEDSPVADPTGWVTCDKHTLVHTKYPNIFSVGDAANYPTSKTASGARKQAEVLTKNLLAKIRGEEPKEKYTGHIICPILTRYGRALFAEFDYEKSISPGEELWSDWVTKVYMLRPMYWSLMLKGLM